MLLLMLNIIGGGSKNDSIKTTTFICLKNANGLKLCQNVSSCPKMDSWVIRPAKVGCEIASHSNDQAWIYQLLWIEVPSIGLSSGDLRSTQKPCRDNFYFCVFLFFNFLPLALLNKKFCKVGSLHLP